MSSIWNNPDVLAVIFELITVPFSTNVSFGTLIVWSSELANWCVSSGSQYNEPVKKILLGLPESVLKQLDSYASANNLSRPKAIANLVEQASI